MEIRSRSPDVHLPWECCSTDSCTLVAIAQIAKKTFEKEILIFKLDEETMKIKRGKSAE